MATVAFCAWLSLTVIVHEPPACGVTEKVALGPAELPAAATVATPEQVSLSLKEPV